MKKVLIVVAVVAGLLAACGKKVASGTVEHEFPSMKECLSEVVVDLRKMYPGEKLRVVIDTPEKIAGQSTPNDLSFVCEMRKTGTRGTFIQGTWSSPL